MSPDPAKRKRHPKGTARAVGAWLQAEVAGYVRQLHKAQNTDPVLSEFKRTIMEAGFQKDVVGSLLSMADVLAFQADIGKDNKTANYFYPEGNVTQENLQGGHKIDMKARDMTGVNVGGTQLIRDITIYKQDLNQAGAVIAAPLKQALIQAREGLEKEKPNISEPIWPLIAGQFEKLDEELRKGDKMDRGVLKTVWSMFWGAVQALPNPVAVVTAVDQLKTLLGF